MKKDIEKFADKLVNAYKKNKLISPLPIKYIKNIKNATRLRKICESKIKTKIIERSGYEEVFTVDGDMTGSSSDYNQIKDSVQTRMNYQ